MFPGEGDQVRGEREGVQSLWLGLLGGLSTQLVKPPETAGDPAGRVCSSHSCHNKQPHPGWLGIRETCAHTVPEARSQKARVGSALLSLKAQKRDLPQAQGPASSSAGLPWLSPARRRIAGQESIGDLWHPLHGAPRSLSPLDEDTGHVGCRAPSLTR